MGRPVSSEPAGARPKAAAALQRYFGPLLEKAGVSRATLPFALAVLALDLLLNVVIIYRVPYTEIDWVAYMQQVEMYVAGERNYTQIRGDTGHLPYPAGHLWIYVALWRLSGNGANIRLMQFLFGGLHTLVLAVVLACYIKTRAVPVWVLALPALSRRIHSIFVLRLFNDCFAALFAYVALYLLASRRPTAACFFFSVGISVKMNVLLYAPALLLLLVKADGLLRAIPPLLLGAAWQVAVAGPFLATYPWEYASRAFNFGRQFIYYWSVNFKMVPEELFLSRPFAASLLATHLVLILGFAHFRWCRHEGGLLRAVLNLPAAAARKGARGRSLVQTALGARGAALNPDHVVTVMLACNLLGILCARTLHYQFYVWYFHGLPFLLWKCPWPSPLRLVVLAAVEAMWNIFPSRAWQSALLFFCHTLVVVGLWLAPTEAPLTKSKGT